MEVKKSSYKKTSSENMILKNSDLNLYSQSNKVLKVRNIQDSSNSQTERVVKTLYSPFHIKPKPFNSIKLCKQNKLAKDKLSKTSTNFFTTFEEQNGPLIVTHKENRKKIKAPPRKYRFEEEAVTKFDYFDKMKNLKESKLLWADTQHPIILKNYNQDFDKNKYSKLDNNRYWTIK